MKIKTRWTLREIYEHRPILSGRKDKDGNAEFTHGPVEYHYRFHETDASLNFGEKIDGLAPGDRIIVTFEKEHPLEPTHTNPAPDRRPDPELSASGVVHSTPGSVDSGSEWRREDALDRDVSAGGD